MIDAHLVQSLYDDRPHASFIGVLLCSLVKTIFSGARWIVMLAVMPGNGYIVGTYLISAFVSHIAFLLYNTPAAMSQPSCH